MAELSSVDSVTAWIALIVAALTTAVWSPRVNAQWLHYPTAGLPRLPDGTPNLAAATPRTADGTPDLSGIWKAVTRPCASCTDPVAEQFLDFGFGVKGGLPYQPWAAALVQQRTARLGRDDPYSQCLPAGVPRTHVIPVFGSKFVQLPRMLIILNERNATYRQVFLDGRPLPTDPQPSWNGYSSGRWTGDTLIVETNGLRDGVWLDRKGSPLTDAASVIERFRRINVGTMEVTISVTDPKAYTAPWTTTVTESLMPDTDLIDAYCLENERDQAHLVTH